MKIEKTSTTELVEDHLDIDGLQKAILKICNKYDCCDARELKADIKDELGKRKIADYLDSENRQSKGNRKH